MMMMKTSFHKKRLSTLQFAGRSSRLATGMRSVDVCPVNKIKSANAHSPSAPPRWCHTYLSFMWRSASAKMMNEHFSISGRSTLLVARGAYVTGRAAGSYRR